MCFYYCRLRRSVAQTSRKFENVCKMLAAYVNIKSTKLYKLDTTKESEPRLNLRRKRLTGMNPWVIPTVNNLHSELWFDSQKRRHREGEESSRSRLWCVDNHLQEMLWFSEYGSQNAIILSMASCLQQCEENFRWKNDLILDSWRLNESDPG